MDYESIRQQYKPAQIEWLLIAESPPPAADVASSRHFYRADRVRRDDRLFVNTVKAFYNEASDKTEAELEPEKEQWLKRLQADGVYMIEVLEDSQEHAVTKGQRQQRIAASVPRLIKRVKQLAGPSTKIILIKSNPFEVAAEPLRQAGFKVLNQKLVDYPGQYNQRDYREKLDQLLLANGWQN